jgi:hypothetical protein
MQTEGHFGAESPSGSRVSSSTRPFLQAGTPATSPNGVGSRSSRSGARFRSRMQLIPCCIVHCKTLTRLSIRCSSITQDHTRASHREFLDSHWPIYSPLLLRDSDSRRGSDNSERKRRQTVDRTAGCQLPWATGRKAKNTRLQACGRGGVGGGSGYLVG